MALTGQAGASAADIYIVQQKIMCKSVPLHGLLDQVFTWNKKSF